MRAFLKKIRARGFFTLELVIALGIISVVIGFAIVKFVQASRTASRTNIAVEIADQLQKARLDSMRRNAKDINQMAQVKIFNRKFYSIAIDGDNDGNLVHDYSRHLRLQLHG